MSQLLLMLFLAASPSAPTPPWQPDGMVDGLRVEHREVPGSKFEELRITTTSARSLEQVCAAVFAQLDERDGRVTRRDLFRRTDTERWVYEQVSAPLVSDRDYVIHEKLEPASSAGCAVTFETADDPAHPPVRGYVRMRAIRGHWSAVPGAGAAVVITYQLFSDPGGDLPAFLVRSGQRGAAIDAMKRVLARAAK